jgi:ABC-type bacteriocin/lantibiotic exporter with double-glycine peptidase domain
MKQISLVLLFVSFALFPIMIILFIRMIILSLIVNSLLKKYEDEIDPFARKKGLELWFDKRYRSIKTQRPKMNLILEWANNLTDVDFPRKQKDKKRLAKYCKKVEKIHRFMGFVILYLVITFIAFYMLKLLP